MIKQNPTQTLVYDIKSQMPNQDLEKSFESLVGLFLEATGNIRLSHSKTKSASSLSRYLNHYQWSTKAMWGQIRRLQLEQLLGCRYRGRPMLRLIVDLTSIEKRGDFAELEPYMHTLDGKYGIHLSVLYLVMGKERVPWSVRLWQGAGTTSPAKLALKQIKQLPNCLKQHHRLIVLADGGYGSKDFMQGLDVLGLDAILSMRSDRKLEDGRRLRDIRYTEKVYPTGLDFAVWATRFRLKGPKDSPGQWRYVVSNRALSDKMIKRWGKRRWAIEAFFKTIKHRFGLHCFGQASRLALYRWFLFCILAYTLAYQAHLQNNPDQPWPDWQQVSALAIELFLPAFLALWLLAQLDSLNSSASRLGWSLELCNCKI